MIKPKWKVFAVRSCFSNEMTPDEAIKLYDDLNTLDGSEEIEKYFDDHDEVILWSPYEFMLPRELVEHVLATARYAQCIEGVPDVYVVLRKGCVAYVSSTEEVKVNVVDHDWLDSGMSETEREVRENLAKANSLPRYW